jgi:hypothetical protein
MDLFDLEGNKKTNIHINKEIFNYYEKKNSFIENPQFYNDNDLIKILKLNYVNYGLVCSSLITNNNDLAKSNKTYFSKKEKILLFLKYDNEIIVPTKFIEVINNYINKITKILELLEGKYREIYEYDYKILLILNQLRYNDYFKYLANLLDLNNIRHMINRIFFEYQQDLSFYLDNLNRLKYDLFITEDDIKTLLDNFYYLKERLGTIFTEQLVLLSNNNSEKTVIKDIHGNINYNNFIKIIEKNIEKI